MEKTTLFDTLIVVKRSGQRTSFQGEKIAIAIKKAFDSVDNNYQEDDINKVYETVLKNIEKEYENRKTIQIEDIQDFIEEILKKKNYEDVFLSFKTYREHRNASRKSFVTKQQHKFLKSIEALGFHDKEDSNFAGQKNPNELLENYGMTIASGFTKSYLLDTKIVRAIDSGLIAIPNLEAIALGSIDSIQLDVTRLLKEKVHLTNGTYQEIINIEDFFQYLLLLIKAVANSVHGQIQIPNLDSDVVPFILETYKECLKEELVSFLEYSGFKLFFNFDRITKEIDKLTCIQESISLGDFYQEEQLLKINFDKASKLARQKLEARIETSLSHFLFNLNSIYDKTMHFPKICIGFGTEAIEEAKIMIQILLKLERNGTFLEPTYCFKLKKNKNFSEKDENYLMMLDYLKLALASRRFLFANLEMKQNKRCYEEDDPTTEVCYFSDGSRVIEDITIQEARVTGGKGNLFTCSINLPRLGLKVCTLDPNDQEKEFFMLLDQSLELAKDALLSCFELFCNKHRLDFPFLLGQNIWQDGKNIKEKDRLRKVFKHGTLSIHFVGLEEVLYLLTKEEKYTNSKEKLAIKILEYMQRKVNTYCTLNNLNFTLSAKKIPEICLEFNKIDAAIYGKVKRITSQKSYHNAFETTVSTWKETLHIESKYHSYTNGGHLSCFMLSNKEESYGKEILKTIQKEAIGAFYFQEKP